MQGEHFPTKMKVFELKCIGKKGINLFSLPLVIASNWEKGVMVLERNDIWPRKTVYGICKHLAKQVITVVLLAKTILLFG